MAPLRLLVTGRPWLALAILVAALAARLVVPAGLMPGAGPRGAMLVACPGEMAMAGMAMPSVAKHPGKADRAKTGFPCAFTGLSLAAIMSSDMPALSATTLPMTCGAVVRLAVVAACTPRLRPPPRGPPPHAA